MEKAKLNKEPKFFRDSRLKTLFFIGVIFATSVLVILPIYFNGIPYGNDLKQHYQFAATIDDAIKSGDFSTNWSQNDNNGYGGVGLRFYPPISYFVLSIGHILLGNWYDASVLAFIFWMFLGSLGIFFWSKEFFTERASFVASILYIFVPYHVVELYASFTYAEFAASGVLPFCFLFISRICKNTKLIDVILLAFCYTVLILTHLPLTVIGSICLLIFTIFSAKLNLKKLAFCGIGAFFGLILTSFHWIKIVTEMSWIKHATETYSASGSANYDFRNHFLLSFPYIYGLENDANSLWYLDLAIIATLLVFLPSAIVFYKNAEKKFKAEMLPIMLVFIISFLMMTKLTQPIWENIAFLQKVQFPWRWFSIVSIFSVLFVAAGFEYCLRIWQTEKRSQSILVFICIAFCVVFTCSQVIRQTTHLNETAFNETIKNIAFEANCDCWLPIWASKNFSVNNEKVVAENRNVTIISWQRLDKTVKIDKGIATDVRLAVLYYPHWKATINDKNVEVFKNHEGVIILPISEVETTIKLNFIEPQSVQIVTLISKLSWLLLSIAAICLLWKTSLKSKI